MKKVFFCLVAVVSICLVSCAGKDVAYEKTYTFNNSVVTGKQPLNFEYEHGKDSFQLYNIVLSIKHMPKLSYGNLPLNLTYVSPIGEQLSVPIAVPVYDKDLKVRGTMQGDTIVTLEQELFYSQRLREGKNMFQITPATFNDSLDGIRSITLRIERAN
ncbi:MAG: hypothetical protein MJ197_06710 [Bacteroidales bacterium]|nr:hypothetical protein [Bacteroidales bacterium]